MSKWLTRLFYLVSMGMLCLFVPRQPVNAQPPTTPVLPQTNGSETTFINTRPDGTFVKGSSPTSLSPLGTCSLPAPTLTAPINGMQVNTLVPRFEWSGTGTNIYAIQVSIYSDFSAPTINTSWTWEGSPPSSFSVYWHHNLVSNTTYYWRVASVCSDYSPGSYSGVASFYTSNITGPFPSPPPMIAPADGAVLSSTTVMFSWGDAPGAVGWQVRLYHTLSDAQNDNNSISAGWADFWANSATLGVDFWRPAGTTFWRLLVLSNTAWGSLSPVRSFRIGVTSIVDEARKDIGMPYPDSPYHRGCPSDYVGCGGPYHGFYLGVCSDLVTDAYNAGVPFNIQNSLYQDYLSNPGRYSWGSARNADDMRRYFIYNQQFLPHSQAYQAGDIAFFSWDGGPITDHVLIVSQVDANGRPLSMVDASGTYSGNPSGRAFEHSWSSYYDQHVQGHGRLSRSGLSPVHAPSAETLQVLSITVDSLSVALSLKDSNGKSTSSTYDESLVASNNAAFIPYIPGGTYANLGTSQVISVTQPLSNTTQYIAQVAGNANTQYHLTIQTLENGGLTATSTFTQTISNGEIQGIPLQLSAPGGVITFSASSSTLLPNVNITPSPIQMSGLPSSLANTSVTVNETSNRQALNGAAASIGTLMDQSGQTIPGTLFTVTPSSFNIAPGGSQNVQLQINLTNISPGVYLGNLMITSTNGGVQSVPLSMKVQAYTLNLPLIMR